MPVDRCVCRSLMFESLKAIAVAERLDYDGLKARTGCGTGCSMCEPYVKLMLQTGRTSFDPIPSPISGGVQGVYTVHRLTPRDPGSGNRVP